MQVLALQKQMEAVPLLLQQQACSQQTQAAQELCAVIRRTRLFRLRLAGCSFGGCRQQGEQYSADAAVVGRRGVRCGGCGLARYCCPQHQERDWVRHRQVCGRLARARARAAAGVTSHQGSSHAG
jgi:hypothetical protein